MTSPPEGKQSKKNLWSLPGWGLFSDPEPFWTEEIPSNQKEKNGEVRCLAWNRDGNLLAVATNEGLYLRRMKIIQQKSGKWEIQETPSSGSREASWKMALTGTFSTILFGKGDCFLLVDRRGMIFPGLVLNNLDIQIGKPLTWDSGGNWQPSFSSDGKLLVAPAENGGIGFYFPYGSEPDRKLLLGDDKRYEQAVVSLNKKWLACSTATDKGSIIFVYSLVFDDRGEWLAHDLEKKLEENLGYGFYVSCLAFNSDASVLYVGGTNHTIIAFVNESGKGWVRKTIRYGGGVGSVNGISFFGDQETYMVSFSENRTLFLWNRGNDRGAKNPDYDAYWVVSYSAGSQVGRMAFNPKNSSLVAHRAEEHKISYYGIDIDDVAKRKYYTQLETFKVLLIGDEPYTSNLFERFRESGNTGLSLECDENGSANDVNIIRVENTDKLWNELFSKFNNNSAHDHVWREIFLCRLPKLDETSGLGAIWNILLNVYIEDADLLVYVIKDPSQDNLIRWIMIIKNLIKMIGRDSNDKTKITIPWILSSVNIDDNGRKKYDLGDWSFHDVVESNLGIFSDEVIGEMRIKIVSALHHSSKIKNNIVNRNNAFPLFRSFIREKFYSGRRIFTPKDFLGNVIKIAPALPKYKMNELKNSFNNFRLPASQSGWITTAPHKELIVINRSAIDTLLVHLLRYASENSRKDGFIYWDEWLSAKFPIELSSQEEQSELQDWVWFLCEQQQLAAAFETFKDNEILLYPRRLLFPLLVREDTFPLEKYLPAPHITYSFNASESDFFHYLVIRILRRYTVRKVDAIWQKGLVFTTPSSEEQALGFFFGEYKRNAKNCCSGNSNFVTLNIFCIDENVSPILWGKFQEYVEAALRAWAFDKIGSNGADEVVAIRKQRFFCTNGDCNFDELDLKEVRKLIDGGISHKKCSCGSPIFIRSDSYEEKKILRDISSSGSSRKQDQFVEWLLSKTDFAFHRRQCDKLTVVFTDIKGSMKLLQDKAESGWYEELQKHFKRAEALLKDDFPNGYLIKNTGDGFVLLFSNSHDAVEYSLELLDNTGSDDIEIRASLHSGPIFIDTVLEDIFGLHVGLTARIMELTKDSIILASHVIIDFIKDNKDLDKRYSYIHTGSIDRSGNRFTVANEDYNNDKPIAGKGTKVQNIDLENEIKVYCIKRAELNQSK
ncbi:MAG: hypothetical protein HQL85_08900 [Magnetococcales bacterium]|nr:hypothetical protein [Magnetococcales bacterium]MBF0631396.1 hypothetical protein [Magnetococcales bacterium]